MGLLALVVATFAVGKRGLKQAAQLARDVGAHAKAAGAAPRGGRLDAVAGQTLKAPRKPRRGLSRFSLAGR